MVRLLFMVQFSIEFCLNYMFLGQQFKWQGNNEAEIDLKRFSVNQCMEGNLFNCLKTRYSSL